MALYKRGKVWWMAYTVQGRLVRKSTKQTNKKKAEDIWADVIKSITTGDYVPDQHRPIPGPPFDIAVEAYVEHRIDEGKKRRSYERLEGRWSAVFKGRAV